MTILVTVIILLLIGLSFAKSKGPQPVDWTPSFMNTKTSPYGTYIAYDLLTDIFEKKNIQTTRVPIYNNLKKINGKYIYYDEENNPSIYYQGNEFTDDELFYNEIEIEDSVLPSVSEDSIYIKEGEDIFIETEFDPTSWYFDLDNITDTTSYLFVNMRFDIDDLDLEYLLNFVGLGNNAFISAETFNNKLLDTLGIHRSYDYFRSDTVFSLPDYPSREYRIGTLSNILALNTDSCPYPVRTLGMNNHNDTVFVDIQYGRGHIYLHTVPTAFANINMLKTTEYDFAFRCLSYLPENSKIIWDEFQKQGMQGRNSYFRVLFANPPLRTALYIVLAGLLLFMIFRAKRTQRIIPVITPPVNSSLEFLGTISNLYYRKKDFTTIAQKRHAYFLDFIRKNYYMSTENTDSDFISRLSAKSGMDKEELSELFSLHKDITILPYVSNELFLKYNSLLEDFYKKAKNK